MERFKLTNLRELSSEEQLRLSGGTDSTGCTCNCGTCSCSNDNISASTKSATSKIADGVKKSLE